jgi:exopolysaccharide production protein ExoZ
MPHYRSIHYLRAVAAMMVVWFHVFYNPDPMRSISGPHLWTRAGVDIFFVISGFIMWRGSNIRPVSPWQFAQNRVRRIVPLYWLMTLGMALLTAAPWQDVVKSLMFVPFSRSSSGLMEPVLPPGWTLNHEMFFYTIFTLALFVQPRWRLPVLAGTFLMVIALSRAADPKSAIAFLGRPIIVDFLIGVAIARYRIVLPAICMPLGLALLPWIHGFETAGGLMTGAGLSASLIVAGALSMEHRLPHWRHLSLVGDASYAVYLAHILSIVVISQYWPWQALGPVAGPIIFVPVAMAASVGCGVALHLIVERRLTALLTRKACPVETGGPPSRWFAVTR